MMIVKSRKLVEINKLLNDHQHQQEEESSQENVAIAADADSSLLSGDEAYDVNPTSPKKRRGGQKKVITIPIGEGGDYGGSSSKSRGEVYPPPDSWSWRKYGQKPIKGSPYPRGYYRCSSSKGCSARKQVERNRNDPTMLLITYTCDHNHSLPTTTKHHHHHRTTTTTTSEAAIEVKPTTTTTSTTSTSSDNMNESTTEAEFPVPDFDSENIRFAEFAGEMGWFSGVADTTLYENSLLLGTSWSEIDKGVMLNIGEEDESLFGDLGELPECSTVFRRLMVGETPCT